MDICPDVTKWYITEGSKKNRIENAMSNLDREETRHGIKLSNDAFSQVEIYVQTFLSTFNLFLLLSKMTKIVKVVKMRLFGKFSNSV